jgi:hypothetical protein
MPGRGKGIAADLIPKPLSEGEGSRVKKSFAD